jgi:hypothetical protein
MAASSDLIAGRLVTAARRDSYGHVQVMEIIDLSGGLPRMVGSVKVSF